MTSTLREKALAAKLSILQLRILEAVEAACRPVQLEMSSDKLTVIPLCTMNLPDAFDSYGARDRFIGNLQARGFLRIEKRSFLYITDQGRGALEWPASQRRLDDYWNAIDARHAALSAGGEKK